MRYYCGAGAHMTCWGDDGRSYPCMRFAPICTSRPLEMIVAADHQAVNERCDECIFEPLCPTCEGYNYEIKGSCLARTDFHCDFFKLELLASARLCLLEEGEELLAPGTGSVIETRDKIRKLLAIKLIQDLCGGLIEH